MLEALSFIGGIIATIATFSFTTGRIVGKFSDRMKAIEKRLEDGDEKLSSHESRLNSVDVNHMKIITKLEEMDVRLIEIREDMHRQEDMLIKQLGKKK